jgi:hypothetical protein
MFQKLKAALLAKLQGELATVEHDLSTSAGRIEAEKSLASLIAEVQPFASSVNPAFGAALTEATALLGKAQAVESATGI